MGKLCSARNCKNRTLADKNFFRFPTDPASAKIWILNSNREDLIDNLNTLYINQRLCEDHFEERMFLDRKRTRLKYKAFPTLFPICNDTRGNMEDPFDLDHSHAAAVSTKRLKNVNKVISQASKGEKKVPVVFTEYESTKPSECEEEIYTNYEFLETSKTTEELGDGYTTSKPKKYVPDFCLGNKSMGATKNKTDVCDVFADIIEASNFSKAFSHVQNEVPDLQLGNGFTEASNCAGDFENEFRDAHTKDHDPVEASKFEKNVRDLFENIFVEASKCEEESCDSRVSNHVEITFSEGEIGDHEASKCESSVLYTGNGIEFVEAPNFQEKIRDVCMHSEVTEALKCGKEVSNSESDTESFKSTKFLGCGPYDEIEFAEASNFDEKISDDMHNEIIAVSKYENKVGNLMNETENVGALKCATEASDSDDEIEFVEASKFDEKVGYFTSETENVEISKNETEVCDLDEETKFFDALVCNENMKDIYAHNETFAALKCGQKVVNSVNETENVESKCKIEVCDSNEEIKVVDVSNFDTKINEFHVYNETFDALKCEQKVENSVVETENVVASNCKTEFCYSNEETESVDASNFDGKLNDVNMHNETFASSRCGQKVGNSVGETENVEASNCKTEVCDSNKETEFVDASNFDEKINDVYMHNETSAASKCGQNNENSVSENEIVEASNCKTEVCDFYIKTEFVEASKFQKEICYVHVNDYNIEIPKCEKEVSDSRTESIEGSTWETEVCDVYNENIIAGDSNFKKEICDNRSNDGAKFLEEVLNIHMKKNDVVRDLKCEDEFTDIHVENVVEDSDKNQLHTMKELSEHNYCIAAYNTSSPEFAKEKNAPSKLRNLLLRESVQNCSTVSQDVSDDDNTSSSTLTAISGSVPVYAENNSLISEKERNTSPEKREFVSVGQKLNSDVLKQYSESSSVTAGCKMKFPTSLKKPISVKRIHSVPVNKFLGNPEKQNTTSVTRSLVQNFSSLYQEKYPPKTVIKRIITPTGRVIVPVGHGDILHSNFEKIAPPTDKRKTISVGNENPQKQINTPPLEQDSVGYGTNISQYLQKHPSTVKLLSVNPMDLEKILPINVIKPSTTPKRNFDSVSHGNDSLSDFVKTTASTTKRKSVSVGHENPKKQNTTTPPNHNLDSIGYVKIFPKYLQKQTATPKVQNVTPIDLGKISLNNSIKQSPTPKRNLSPVGHANHVLPKLVKSTEKRKFVSVGNDNPQKQNTTTLSNQKQTITPKVQNVTPIYLGKITPNDLIKQSPTIIRSLGPVGRGNDSLSNLVKSTASTAKRKFVSVGHDNPQKQNTTALSNPKQMITPKLQNVTPIYLGKITPNDLIKQSPTTIRSLGPVGHETDSLSNLVKSTASTAKRKFVSVGHGTDSLSNLVSSTAKRKSVSVGHENPQKQNNTAPLNQNSDPIGYVKILPQYVQKQTTTPKLHSVTLMDREKILPKNFMNRSPTSLGPVGHENNSLSKSVKTTAPIAKRKSVSVGYGNENQKEQLDPNVQSRLLPLPEDDLPPNKVQKYQPVNEKYSSTVKLKVNSVPPNVRTCKEITPSVNSDIKVAPNGPNFNSVDQVNLMPKGEQLTILPQGVNFLSLGHGSNLLFDAKQLTTAPEVPKVFSVTDGNNLLLNADQFTTIPEIRNYIAVGHGNNLLLRASQLNTQQTATIGQGSNLLVNTDPLNLPQNVSNNVPYANGINLLVNADQLTLPQRAPYFVSFGHENNLLVNPHPLRTQEVLQISQGEKTFLLVPEVKTLPPEVRKYVLIGNENNFVLNPQESVPLAEIEKFHAVVTGINLPVNSGVNFAAPEVRNCIPGNVGICSPVESGVKSAEVRRCIPVGLKDVSSVNSGVKSAEVRKYIPAGLEDTSSVHSGVKSAEVRRCIPAGLEDTSSVNSGLKSSEVRRYIPAGLEDTSSVNSGVKSAEVRRCIPAGSEDISSVNSGVKSAEVRRYIPAGLEDTSSVNSGVKSVRSKVRDGNSVDIETGSCMNSGVKSVNPIEGDGIPVGIEASSFENSGVKYANSNLLECLSVESGIVSIVSSELKAAGSTSDKTTDTFERSVVKTGAPEMRKFDSVLDSFNTKRQKSLTKEIHVSVSSTQTDCYLSANSPRKKKLRQWIKELNRENKFLKRRLLQVETQLSNKR